MIEGATGTAVAARLTGPRWRPGRRLAIYALLAIVTLLLWQVVSALTLPIFFPPPSEVAAAFLKTLLDGTLIEHVGVSYLRILAGWTIGCAIAVPLGLLAGRSALTRMLVEPYIEFFRYIPPIAFIGLFLIWFGLGETSKVLLIVYTALFVTFVNTLAGALAVEPEKIRAAQCLGATPRQIFTHVVVPATEFARVSTGAGWLALPPLIREIPAPPTWKIVFWRISLPQLRPALSALGIITFTQTWNYYFQAKVLLQAQNSMNLPLAMDALRGYMQSGNLSLVMAAMSMAVAPVILLFLVAQKMIIEGVTMSGIRG